MTHWIAPGISHAALRNCMQPLKERICTVVCEFYGVKLSDLKSKSRKSIHVEPRHVIMHQLKPYMTLQNIGKMFGGRDHSTVIYASEAIEDRLTTSRDFRLKFNEIQRILQ